MSEKKYEVWWSGKKEWAEPCEVAEYHGNVVWIDDQNGRRSIIPADWLRPVEPEIAPGTPVEAWREAKKPDAPAVGYLESIGMAGIYVRFPNPIHNGHNDTVAVFDLDHVEPIAQQPEIDPRVIETLERITQYSSSCGYAITSTTTYKDLTKLVSKFWDEISTVRRLAQEALEIIPRPETDRPAG